MCGYECTSVDVFTLSNPTIVSYAMDLFVLILICTPLRQYVVVTNIAMSIHVCTPLRQHVVVMVHILVSITILLRVYSLYRVRD